MTRDYMAMGNEMTTALGMEDRKVILYWKAFEEKRFLECGLLYKRFQQGRRRA